MDRIREIHMTTVLAVEVLDGIPVPEVPEHIESSTQNL